MLLERFHNKLHNSRFSKHSSSTPAAAAAPDKRTVEQGNQDNMLVDDGPSSEAIGSTKPQELRINTQLCNLRSFTPQNGVSTSVSTPSAQPIMPYMYMNQKRQDSVASFTSSISDLPGSVRPPVPTSFPAQFLRLLMEVYQDICSDPTATPFDISNPPPGILNRAAKLAVSRAEERGVDYGREKNAILITAVRQRLQQEVRQDNYLSRNSSVVSLPPMPMFNPSDLTPPMPTDYFSLQSELPHQQPLSAPFQMPNYGTNQLQAPQMPYEPRSSFQKTVQRSRNESFISVAGRSRSGSNHVHPFQQLQPASSFEPVSARSRSGSNGLFALTPTSSFMGEYQRPIVSRQRSNESAAFEL
ncbi:LAME_0A03532g1_1 [Lachancea meyersii CBS 8951]|uniref:LAME_0A03532g1_1 n=1 Tax=Lachancea meyersii CBS 8951 TaxID=1266667 RepID=A0A1G4INY2_9SACH|nr:LAME_0A03532g1_1 [Lachancea meyersii CBS 8951]